MGERCGKRGRKCGKDGGKLTHNLCTVTPARGQQQALQGILSSSAGND